jgi:two-component system sensor histidine kinase PilS (NtrC family)
VDLKSAQLELQDLVASQQRASSAREQLNRSIINNARLGMIYLAADGRVEIFNPAAQELFNRGFAAVKNLPLAEAIPDHAELAEFILAGDRKSSCEFEYGPSILAVDVVPVATGDDAPREGISSGRLALVRDVSAERKRERVRRQNDNLLMLGEMAASLAHEVRNSLGVILGYSKAMSGEPEKTAKVIREVQFVTEMMESFLRFARPVDKVARKPVDLAPLIAAAAAAHDLPVEFPAGRLELQSDPLLLNIVFGNLALNARQAGAKSLNVEFLPGDAPGVVLADDGLGISAANADKIWLPFFTSRDKGTGMGLATVKKLVGALGADIQLLNPGEAGARFKITFYS